MLQILINYDLYNFLYVQFYNTEVNTNFIDLKYYRNKET
jgi:hypothetical protein